MDTFITDVSTTSTNIAIASRTESRLALAVGSGSPAGTPSAMARRSITHAAGGLGAGARPPPRVCGDETTKGVRITTAGTSSSVDELAKLADLKDRGAISDEE